MNYEPLFSDHNKTEIVQVEAPLSIIDAVLNPYGASEADYIEARLWANKIQSQLRQSYPNVSYINTNKSPKPHYNPFYGYMDFTVNFRDEKTFFDVKEIKKLPLWSENKQEVNNDSNDSNDSGSESIKYALIGVPTFALPIFGFLLLIIIIL